MEAKARDWQNPITVQKAMSRTGEEIQSNGGSQYLMAGY